MVVPATVLAVAERASKLAGGMVKLRLTWFGCGFALHGQTGLTVSMNCDASAVFINVIWKRR